MHVTPRPPPEATRRDFPPIIDLDGPRPRRVVVPRTDPSDFMPLGDPDDPNPQFTEEIMNAHILRKFKMPTIKAYDGTGDPVNHVRTFSNALLLQLVNDAIKCRAFLQTLSGMAQRWYIHLPPNSIGSFKDLSQAFIKQFISGRAYEKSLAFLMGLVQGAKKSLRDYLNRFMKKALKVPILDEKVAIIALQKGTRDEFFKMSLTKRPPESMLQLQDRAGKYIKVEEIVYTTYAPDLKSSAGKAVLIEKGKGIPLKDILNVCVSKRPNDSLTQNIVQDLNRVFLFTFLGLALVGPTLHFWNLTQRQRELIEEFSKEEHGKYDKIDEKRNAADASG
ncbi:hypothetical protein AgCh_010723 [Apium graveolens]